MAKGSQEVQNSGYLTLPHITSQIQEDSRRCREKQKPRDHEENKVRILSQQDRKKTTICGLKDIIIEP